MVEKEKILILGLGNEILMDDGIAPRLVQEIADQYPFANVVYQTASVGGLDLVDQIQGYRTVILVDAIKTGKKKPGTVIFLTPADFSETLHLSNLHDISFLQAINMAEKIGINVPETIHIIAVEIIEDRVFGRQFTPEVERQYPAIKSEVINFLRTFFNQEAPCQTSVKTSS